MKQKWIWGWLLCLFFWQAGAAAPSDYNVDVFLGWEGCYRPSQWTPVEVRIGIYTDEPVSRIFELSTAQDSLNRLNISQSVVLTPEIMTPIPLVAKFAWSSDDFDLVLRNEKGRGEWRDSYNLLGSGQERLRAQPVFTQDMLIGVTGRRQFGLDNLASQLTSLMDDNQPGTVYIKHKLERMLPWDWTGYASLDALICFDPDWSQLRPEQWRALAEWVSNGGQLFIILGEHQLPTNQALGAILPATTGAMKEVATPPMLMQEWGIPSQQAPSMKIAPLQVSPVAIVHATQYCEADPVYVFASVGFGRIAMMGCDLHQFDQIPNQQKTSFWLQQLERLIDQKKSNSFGSNSTQRRLKRTESDSDSRSRNHGGELDQVQKSTNAILEHLYNIEQMRPLSIIWVILLLVLLAILIGPVDYIVLKRLDKQPLTWLTSTFWIVVFTVGAYYGVQALRAGDLQMRAVTITDGIRDENHNWSTHYCGIFAPKNDEYAWEDPGPRQWWAGLAPSEGYLGRYGGHYGTRDIYCAQQDGRNIPLATPINIWTMQCLQNERALPKHLIKADIQRDGDSLAVSVTNEGTSPLERCAVFVSDRRGVDMGPIGPGKNITKTATIDSLSIWWQRSLVTGGMNYTDLYTARGSAPRTEAIKQYLDKGAFLVVAETVELESPYRLKEKEYETHHIHVQRLVVLANE